MNYRKWLAALIAVFALALVAGCGSSDSSTSSTAASSGGTDTTAATDTTSSSGGSTDISGNATSEDVYNACEDAINNASEGQAGCQAAKDAFDQCEQQASSLSGSSKGIAEKACQDAANKAVAALQSAP
jgi:ABC-type phosphate transport system substrate-binding protein